MGLALKIKEKITPDTHKSKNSQGGETNMHPQNNARGSPPSASDVEPAGQNGIEKTQTFRAHRPRDSGIEIGHDSRFIEHVDVDSFDAEQGPIDTSGAHTKDPVSNHLPDKSRKPSAGVLTPGVVAVGGGRYSNEPAAGPSHKLQTEGTGAFVSSKAGFKPDYLTLEDPGNSTLHNRDNPRPNLQNTRAYKSDAPLGIPKRSIVDGYGKDPSSPDSRLVMEKSSSPPRSEGHGHSHGAQRRKPMNPGVTPDTSVNYLRDYAPDFKSGDHPPRSDIAPSNNSDNEFSTGHQFRRDSSVDRATVPYAGELDKVEDIQGRAHDGDGHGKDSTQSTLSGVKESGIGRGGIHNGVVGHGANR